MSVKIRIKNLKNIVSLDYTLPNQSGVYVITGLNGCGKTSLLVAINRITYPNAFRDYYMQARSDIDTYSRSQISYVAGDSTIVYKHRNQRWVPSPRGSQGLRNLTGISETLFIPTSNMRFFIPEKSKIPGGNLRYRNASQEMVTTLNSILSTAKFSDLKFVQINRRLGRRPRPYRSDVLYAIKTAANTYTEYTFSLGERLLLNVLDYIERVGDGGVLMIDEMELALHPMAQIKLYDYLCSIAENKNLRVLLTTHSSSLIHHAKQLTFLESRDGVVTVLDKCKPAYVLKDLSIPEETSPDYILFVEDDMAARLLNAVLRYSRVAQRKHRVCRVVPVGGYIQVIAMTKLYYTLPPFNNRKICAFLDKDVEATIHMIRLKGRMKTEKEKQVIQQIDELLEDHDLAYLDITPEIGVWRWIEHDSSYFAAYLNDLYGEQPFRMQDVVSKVLAQAAGADNEREQGKTRLRQLAEELKNYIEYPNYERIYDDIIASYGKYCMEQSEEKKNYYLSKLESVLNR